MENTTTTETIHEVVVLSDNTELQQNLEKENITEAVIVGLKGKYLNLKISGIDDKAGYVAVDEARKDVKRFRVLAEKVGEEITSPLNQKHKKAVADVKKIISRFTEIENSLAAKKKFIDDEKEKIAAAEKERKEKIALDRVTELAKYGQYVHVVIVATWTDVEYATRINEAVAVKEKKDAEVAEEKRLAKVESDRIEAQRVEQEKERQRLAKIASDQEAEAKKLRKEREVLAAAVMWNRNQELRPYVIFIRDYSALLAKDENEYQAEFAQIKIGAELQWEDDRKKMAKDAAKREEESKIRAKEAADKIESDKKSAIQKALKDAEEKVAAEKAEAERIELLRPDKEKIQLFLQSLSEIKYPVVTTGAALEFVEEIQSSINLLVNDMNEKINSL